MLGPVFELVPVVLFDFGNDFHKPLILFIVLLLATKARKMKNPVKYIKKGKQSSKDIKCFSINFVSKNIYFELLTVLTPP